ncbi:hypothetical protein GPECTOR_43g909 [Gonium pectorale]|uniref:Protein kinase domain-containing protein n=1 Tax=Gonium pectorale TaxID=33097 RepID=A0A150G9N3_GONPE|nr:hypothetical protein GPECTOR_43g909 [Gonium pectorale]|eukprot:KXZ46473.1 hypothetical protein GPECTOR_43g909 [Gonium pectorale]
MTLSAQAQGKSVEIMSGKELVVALADPDVGVAVVLADITLQESDFAGRDTPLPLLRNFTLQGRYLTDVDGALARTLVDFGLCQAKVRLGPGVTLRLVRLTVVNFAARNLMLAPHIELLAPGPTGAPGEWALVLSEDCFGVYAGAGAASAPARLERRCWPVLTEFDDFAQTAFDADSTQKQVPQGYIMAMFQTRMACSRVLPLDCVSALGVLGCMTAALSGLPIPSSSSSLSWSLQDPLPPPAAAVLPNEGPVGADGGAAAWAPGGATSRGSGGPSGDRLAAIVAGSVLGGLLLAGAIATAAWVLVSRRCGHRDRNRRQKSCHAAAAAAAFTPVGPAAAESGARSCVGIELSAEAEGGDGRKGAGGDDDDLGALGWLSSRDTQSPIVHRPGTYSTLPSSDYGTCLAMAPKYGVLDSESTADSGPGAQHYASAPTLGTSCLAAAAAALAAAAATTAGAEATHSGAGGARSRLAGPRRAPELCLSLHPDPAAAAVAARHGSFRVVTPLTPTHADVLDDPRVAGDEVILLPTVLGKGAVGRVVEGTYQGRLVAVKLIADDLLESWGLPSSPTATATAAHGSGSRGPIPEGAGASAGGLPLGAKAGSSNVAAAAAAAAPTFGSAVNDGGGSGDGGDSGDGGGGTVCDGPQAALAESLAQEVEVLGRCRHPNVVTLLAACLTPPRMCLVMERMETSLERLLYGGGPGHLLPMEQVLAIALDVARGLEYLHPTIVHRDLKPGNVLIDNPGTPRVVAKLSDFGLSRLHGTVGGVLTANPEAGTVGEALYSFGVLLWAMLSGLRPWEGLQLVAIAVRVTMLGQRPPLDDVPAGRLPPKLARLLRQCWDAEPERRPAAAELVKELLLVREQMIREGRGKECLLGARVVGPC